MTEHPQSSPKDQKFMMIGALLCVAAALLSFFLGSFTGGAKTLLIVLLLLCTFGGIALVGIGIRMNKKRQSNQEHDES